MLAVPLAFAEGSVPKPEHKYYFMIDASGSMEPRMAAALNEVRKLRSGIEATDPDAIIYVRFFRAANFNECNQPISIFEAIQPGDPLDVPQRYYDDYSPIGGALLAAVEHSGDASASVILVTDAAQSAGCGPSVADVVAETSGQKDLAIRSILIGARDSDLETYKGIEQSGLIEVSLLDSDLPAQEQTNESQGSKGREQTETDEEQSTGGILTQVLFQSWNAVLRFFDQWLWLIGFVGLAWSAAWIGRVDSNRTVSINNFTREARSQKELIRQNDPKAPAELKKIEEEKKKLDGETIVKRSWLLKRKAIPGWIGFTILAALAFLPPRIGPIGLEGSKAAAWAILDSDFATAFAAIWIALIVYAGRENQRLSEAESTFDVVTQEAERLGKLEESEAQKAAYSDFEAHYARLENIEFPKYWQQDEVEDEDRTNFELVVETAIEYAKSVAVGPTAEAEDSRAAIQKLKNLYVKTDGFRSRASFARFVDKLILVGLVEKDTELWSSLSRAIKSNSRIRMAGAYSDLAVSLRSESPV